ncbi:MAG: C-GCAxxG-C-C family protein [Desulfobacterales bacterium]|nr:C-GCAxxG-C-C family protein [Desulfobacterales bacterium]
MATQWFLSLEDRKILKAATGLGGGIGHEGDTCGALTGGVLSLGLYNQDHDYHRLCGDCIDFYRRFTRRFRTSKCREITGVRFKEGYDIRRFFLKGIRCLKVVYTSIESVFDIIQRPDSALPPKGPYRITPPFGTDEFHCASAVLSRIESQLKLNLDSISRMTQGFSGGIAFQGDICGALMGGVLALGTVYGTELQRTQPAMVFRAGFAAMKEGSRVFQNEDLHPSFKTSLRVGKLYRKFVSRFGSADCTDILGKACRPKNRDLCEEIAQTTSQFTLDLITGAR